MICDLIDESEHTLYEAKGDLHRTFIRRVLGQLVDYRRFEPAATRLAVLSPRRPSADLIALMHSLPAVAVGRSGDEWERLDPR